MISTQWHLHPTLSSAIDRLPCLLDGLTVTDWPRRVLSGLQPQPEGSFRIPQGQGSTNQFLWHLFFFFFSSPGALAAAQILRLKFPVSAVTASLDIDTRTN